MVFNNVFDVNDHINDKIDSSVYPEQKHHILQGNIGSLIAGNSRIHSTISETPSILGVAGEVRNPEQIITSKHGKAISPSGKTVNVPLSFYDDQSPLFFGESGFGIDWDVLNNPRNNIGYYLDFNGKRSLGFSHHALPGTNIKAIPHPHPIEIIQKNERLVPSLQHISKAFPGLSPTVGDWTKHSTLHNSGLTGV